MTTIFFPLFEWLLGDDDQDTIKARNSIRSRNNRAMSHLAAGRTARAIRLYERTLAESERVLGRDDQNTLRARNNLAMSYRTAGRAAEAISLLERTLADCKRVLGPNHPDTRTTRSNLAMSHQAAGTHGQGVPTA